MMHRRLIWLFVLVILTGCTGPRQYNAHAGTIVGRSGSCLNSITFDNKSGDEALVKLIDPNKAERSVAVSNGSKATINNVCYGTHYIKVRYGTNGRFRYTRGDSFLMTGDGVTRRSMATITLHGVANGNYSTFPLSAKDF